MNPDPDANGGDRAPLRRNAAFQRLFWAGIASQCGSTVATLAITYLVFTTTGSALAVAYVALAATLGTLVFALPMGVFADRHDRRRLLIVADVVRAVALGFLAADVALFGLNLAAVVAVTFAVAIPTTLFTPAEQGLVPVLVSPGRLSDANGLLRASREIVGFVASALGGALILLIGAVAAIASNSVTFLVSAALISLVTVPARLDRALASEPTPPGMVREIREGMGWLRRSPGLLALAVSAGPMNFFASIPGTFLVIYTTVALHGSALTFGAMVGLLTAGSALGALLVGRTGAAAHAGKAWVIAYGIAGGLMLIVLGIAPRIEVALPAAFAFGVASAYAGNAWLTAAQRVVPGPIQGRYFAVDNILSNGVVPIAQLAGAFLVVAFGVAATFTLSGIGLAGVGALAIASGPLWRFGASVPTHPHPPVEP